jgi:PAS domain S-box-containing protein
MRFRPAIPQLAESSKIPLSSGGVNDTRIHPEREEWLLQFAHEIPAYVWMTTANGENSFISRPLADFLGSAEEKLGKNWNIYFHPDDADRAMEKVLQSVAARCEFVDEYRLRRFDREYRWFLAKGRPRFSSVGEFLGHSGSLLDITERRIAEQSARESADLVQAQNRALELIAKNTPLPTVLDALVRGIEILSPDMLGSILLLDSDGVHLRHGAAPSLPEAYNRSIHGESIGPVAASCGTAAFRREPVMVEDIAADPLWESYRELALQHGLRAFWSTPIFEEKEHEQASLLGTFALYFHSPGLPTTRHRELIRMATQTAAIAIVKARETEALRNSEERLRLATTGGNLGVWEWKIDTKQLIWSDNLKLLFERPINADLTFQMLFDAIHPEDRDRVEGALGLAITTHVDYDSEYRICLNDGSIRWVASHGRTQFGPAGEALRMLGVTRDITSRKEAEEEIARRETQLVEAQRIAHIGSYEWDIRADKVYRSAELYQIFGVSHDEFEPTFEGYLARIHPEDRASTKEAIERAFRECKPFDHEERIVRPDGRVKVLRSQGQWLCEPAGPPLKLIGTCQDITDRKQAEEQQRAAHAALAQELKERARAEKEIQNLSARLINAQEEERTRLARELHDDLSQQIAALSVAVSNLKRGIPAEFAETLAQSERIREKLTHLADSTRRLSHELHPATLQHCGLDVALAALCSEFGKLAGIRLAFRSDGSFDSVPPAIALCAYRVTQEALQNIAKHAQTDQADVTLTHLSRALRLTVSDEGVGMDLNATSRGLGLTSISERTRLVNGTVDIQSERNRGTTLTLTLPLPA